MHPPKRLQPGNIVGIVSTSSPVSADSVDRMIKYFEEKGYPVQVAPNVLATFGFMAGPPQVRTNDFNLMLHDQNIRMIVTSMGGAGAVHLIPSVDYQTLSSDPKIIVGLSNPSVLMNVITSVADVPTFHGPNGVEFGEIAPLTEFTEKGFWSMVAGDLPIPYVFPIGEVMKVIRAGGIVEGRLIGGHLRTIQVLIGTPWAPKWKDSILFIEELQVELFRTDAMLAHLRLAGILDSIKGLIVGQPVECDPVQVETLEDILLRNCSGYDFPIVTNVPIGHTDDKITVPIGCRVRLNSIEPSLELLESPTC